MFKTEPCFREWRTALQNLEYCNVEDKMEIPTTFPNSCVENQRKHVSMFVNIDLGLWKFTAFRRKVKCSCFLLLTRGDAGQDDSGEAIPWQHLWRWRWRWWWWKMQHAVWWSAYMWSAFTSPRKVQPGWDLQIARPQWRVHSFLPLPFLMMKDHHSHSPATI